MDAFNHERFCCGLVHRAVVVAAEHAFGAHDLALLGQGCGVRIAVEEGSEFVFPVDGVRGIEAGAAG